MKIADFVTATNFCKKCIDQSKKLLQAGCGNKKKYHAIYVTSRSLNYDINYRHFPGTIILRQACHKLISLSYKWGIFFASPFAMNFLFLWLPETWRFFLKFVYNVHTPFHKLKKHNINCSNIEKSENKRKNNYLKNGIYSRQVIFIIERTWLLCMIIISTTLD